MRKERGMEKRKKTGKGVGLRQKAKKAWGRVFAADIFVAILQPGIKVYCAVLRTSLSPRDLFVYSLAVRVPIITDLSLLRETPWARLRQTTETSVLGKIWRFTLHRSKYRQDFARCKKPSWRLSPLENSSSVANYFCNCSLARAVKDAAGRSSKMGSNSDLLRPFFKVWKCLEWDIKHYQAM